MLALYRSGRQAEELRAYQKTRAYLADELGLEPSAQLRELERRILNQDGSLLSRNALQAETGAWGAFGRWLRGYELREQVGTGDHGVLYRAYEPTAGREVAIKVIRSELVNELSFVRGFEGEADVVAQLEHPHLVPLYDYWRDPEGAYLVMRWLRGGSLRQALDLGPWNLEPATRLLSQVAGALAYAHRHGVLHRSVKPSNVLLDGDGNGYLSDFGIASRLADSQGSGPASAYVAPEELAGEPPTPRSDIYGLGVLMFELLTGRRPAPDGPLPPLRSVRPELPPELDDVVARAAAPAPDERSSRSNACWLPSRLP
jgi:serine/threonine protein kinase